MWPTYAKWWDECEIVPGRAHELAGFVKRAMARKERYQVVSEKTGVPWWMIAIIAERESTQKFSRSIAQGDRWSNIHLHRFRN